jgi:hypothetical protein
MSAPTARVADPLHRALRTELLRLARQEEERAARVAQGVHYWESMPVAVTVHRQAAAALRAAADELLTPSTTEPSHG